MPDVHTLALPHDEYAPALARRFVADHAFAHPVEVVDDALLLASELVTNAVRYGLAPISVQIRSADGSLEVRVHDCGAALPPESPPDSAPDQPGGRGLLIVDAIATRWGVASDEPGPGKTVWFSIATPTPQQASAEHRTEASSANGTTR